MALPKSVRGRRLAAAIGVLLLAAGAAAAEPVKVRIGWSTMPGHLIPVLYSKPEILRHIGKSYTVETVAFRGSSPQITAMAAREVDLVAYSPATLALSVLNAKLDVRVVADIIQDGKPGHHTETWLARADSGIKEPKDLKGKRIATNAIGSASDTAMRAMMKKVGLQAPRDFTTIEAAFPTMPALLDEGKVDAAVILMPRLAELKATGKYTAVFTARDAWGETDLVFLAGRGEFLDQNREALKDFFEDHVRSVRWFVDPKNRAEAIGIIAKFMKVEPAALDYLFTERDYYRDPFLRPNLLTMQGAIDTTHELGLIPGTIKIQPKHVDLSFLDEAQRRIEAAP